MPGNKEPSTGARRPARSRSGPQASVTAAAERRRPSSLRPHGYAQTARCRATLPESLVSAPRWRGTTGVETRPGDEASTGTPVDVGGTITDPRGLGDLRDDALVQGDGGGARLRAAERNSPYSSSERPVVVFAHARRRPRMPSSSDAARPWASSRGVGPRRAQERAGGTVRHLYRLDLCRKPVSARAAAPAPRGDRAEGRVGRVAEFRSRQTRPGNARRPSRGAAGSKSVGDLPGMHAYAAVNEQATTAASHAPTRRFRDALMGPISNRVRMTRCTANVDIAPTVARMPRSTCRALRDERLRRH